MFTPERLADIVAELTDDLVDDFDLLEFLHSLTDHAVTATGGSASGLVLVDHRGMLHYVASSAEDARSLELFQLQNEDGPCLDCVRTGERVVCADLGSMESRWPSFAREAIDRGYWSVHAEPLQVAGRAIGAINVFGEETGEPDEVSVGVARTLANLASVGVLHERELARASNVTAQLQGVFNSRIAVEQAKGVIAARRGGDIDEALRFLRAYAGRTGQHLADAARVVTSEPAADEWVGEGSRPA